MSEDLPDFHSVSDFRPPNVAVVRNASLQFRLLRSTCFQLHTLALDLVLAFLYSKNMRNDGCGVPKWVGCCATLRLCVCGARPVDCYHTDSRAQAGTLRKPRFYESSRLAAYSQWQRNQLLTGTATTSPISVGWRTLAKLSLPSAAVSSRVSRDFLRLRICLEPNLDTPSL